MSLGKKAISIIAASVVAVAAIAGTAYGIKTNADKKALAKYENISIAIEQSISESIIASEKAASELNEKLSKEISTSTTVPTTEKDKELESRIESLEKEHAEQEKAESESLLEEKKKEEYNKKRKNIIEKYEQMMREAQGKPDEIILQDDARHWLNEQLDNLDNEYNY